MWIRIETNVADNDKIHCFAKRLGISVEETMGFLIRIWGKIAEHRTDGNIDGVLDSTIEDWTLWRYERGAFASAFREHFVSGCDVIDWADKQGKLIARQAVDRLRKRSGISTEVPRERPGESTPTKRNETKVKLDKNNVRADDVAAVVDFYLESHPRRSVVNVAAKKKVRTRLNEGFTVDQLKDAISGNATDPWHVDVGKHGLDYILRNPDMVNDFVAKRDRQNQIEPGFDL